jgi:hypothetical protein
MSPSFLAERTQETNGRETNASRTFSPVTSPDSKPMTRFFHRFAFLAFALVSLSMVAGAEGDKKTLNVLFIGNSFTARHSLSTVVKAMAEAGNPGLTFNPRTSSMAGAR